MKIDSLFESINKYLRDRSSITPDELLDALILDGLTAIEQMIDFDDTLKENIEFVFSTYTSKDLENISSNIIVLNGKIQEHLRKRKHNENS